MPQPPTFFNVPAASKNAPRTLGSSYIRWNIHHSLHAGHWLRGSSKNDQPTRASDGWSMMVSHWIAGTVESTSPSSLNPTIINFLEQLLLGLPNQPVYHGPDVIHVELDVGVHDRVPNPLDLPG